MTKSQRAFVAFQTLLISILCCYSLTATSKTLLVTDIDDTIKISHVGNKMDALAYLPQTQARFLGMRELFQFLRNTLNDVEIVYLSNAYKELFQDFHFDFLKLSGFPGGSVYMRNLFYQNDYKLNVLQFLAKSRQPDRIILFGDNGEQDPISYRMFTQPIDRNIKTNTFIRAAYRGRVNLQSGQTYFVTPIEVLLELNELGLINNSQADHFINIMAPYISIENQMSKYEPQFFPEWMNCQNMNWKWKRSTSAIEMVKQKIYQVCINR